MATIEELLAQLDLSKFSPKFKEEDIDLAAAKKLSEDDLKALGLTLGARRKLLDALQSGAPAAAGGGSKPAVAAAPSATVINDVRDYHWLNGGKNFLEGQSSGGVMLHPRVPVGNPKSDRFLGISGEIRLWDINAGQSAVTIKPKQNSYFSDADMEGDLIVAVGPAQENNDVWLFNSTGKELATYQALKEGGFYHTAVNHSASGSLQALATPFNIPCRTVLFDIGESSIKVASKFEINDCGGGGQIYNDALTRAPGHPGVYVLAGGGNYIGVIDGREKRVVRKIIGVEYPETVSFPANSNGQFLVRGSIRSPTRIIDFGTGKILHTITAPDNQGSWRSAAMFANAVVTYSGDAQFYYFYDLRGAPAEIKEAQHELKNVLETSKVQMTDKYVIGTSENGNLHAVSL